MSARFRVRTPQGQELSFGSEEMFADFVKSGDLSSGDLVYDATSGEWSPASTHSVVLGILAAFAEHRTEGDSAEGDAGDASIAGGGGGEAAEAPPTPGIPTVMGGLSLELAPEQTPEEAAAAFVRQMEEERELDRDHVEEVFGLEPDASGTGLLRQELQRPPERPVKAPDRVPPTPREGGRTRDRTAAGSRGAPPTRGTLTGGATRRPSAGFVRAVAGLALIIVAILVGPDLVALATGPGEEPPVEAQPDRPVISDDEEVLARRAETGFLARIRAETAGLPAIPAAWLDGRYLSNASAYPEVRDTWVRYRDLARRLRIDETEHFSAAYLGALDDARVSGAARTLRLASAMTRFEADRTVREAHYRRIDDLATAAIDLHDLLLEMEDDITYEPAVGSRVSADPVLQAAGRDPATQQRLEAALDRTLDALSAGGAGPVDARAVPAWVFDGLRAVVTPE